MTHSTEEIEDAFEVGMGGLPPVPPRYNIAPTQPLLAIRPDEGRRREVTWFHWGLIPSWAKDPSMGARMINARAETILEKPSFKTSFARRRCLIVADGFYEWQRVGKTKQPFHFAFNNRTLFAFAGLFDFWERDGNAIASCTIITTAANEEVQEIHDRMPVILQPSEYDTWLNTQNKDMEGAIALLQSRPLANFIHYPVDTAVNSVRNDEARLIEDTRNSA
ncbi:MAG: SOS response-associated peptidase [Oculatellaceae cyanobacterium Prado106]|nr:SOS response-associated peptidase [Oculatellaceae cyanobacterium Prado106]